MVIYLANKYISVQSIRISPAYSFHLSQNVCLHYIYIIRNSENNFYFSPNIEILCSFYYLNNYFQLFKNCIKVYDRISACFNRQIWIY